MQSALLDPRRIDPRRIVLGLVLAAIALALIAGGGWLIALGGSAYYLLAGLAVIGSAWLIARGDRRGIWLYGAMLIGTLLWALAESGGNSWGLQARILAPVVLGLWVGWPYIRRIGARGLIVVAIAVAVLLAVLLHLGDRTEAPVTTAAASSAPADWQHYGNTIAGTRFSPASQITPGNVAGLERAWTYRTGIKQSRMGFETTPLMVNDTLYLCTPNNVIVALDPDTGARRWQYDPKVNAPPTGTCRGVSYYRVPNATGPCAERILTATTDARLLAVDATTGAPCSGFGTGGAVDLRVGMGRVDKGYYYVSSAPAIVRGNVILGGWVLDGQYVGEPSGVIRGFDAVTGQFAWAWDMERPDDHGLPPPGKTYSHGTPNSWGPISADEVLGLVYLPMGNSTPDYWGGHRSATSEKFTDAVVALDAATGHLRWSFQTARHDLWDYDVAGQPTLIDLPLGGRTVPALAQATKRGELFLLDRRTGTPLKKVEDRPVPQGAAPGDFTAPTQPFSVGLPSFDDTVIRERTMWGATPIDQLWCRIKFRQARYEGPMTPPGIRPSITYPSYLGGIDWGGISVDPERHLAIVNWNRMANYTRLVPRADATGVKPSIDGGIHVGDPVPQIGTPFALFTGAFLSPLGIPCTEPPYGKIGVVDLVSGKMVWQRPLGSAAGSGPLDLRSHLPIPMGVPNQGGSLTTRTGLIFIAASQDRAIWAFEVSSGRKLWQSALPVGGHANPMTYVSAKTGRQYVVIADGGNASLHSGSGDYVIAFALPRGR
ncbi:membrane-bound PQQ-dependent dehydrogenase, glucose/quinate/shikimate family [Sphingomonas profundi]|uniref:membrane-bound PQQ-dependent dehydrogenase, glucose/quinate/shikimate family n=1 Tax=Alterirhizorhabdus profundi TaxID=2681549 RepID=UPI0012E7E3F9|nr:membrane-bound PQQ-dependent dehydrogenase, glucose/quinate/shikimate family [Sphingomonas profundi]